VVERLETQAKTTYHKFTFVKEGWGLKTSDKPAGSQPICEDRKLHNGGSSLAPRLPRVIGLDGKAGLERCKP